MKFPIAALAVLLACSLASSARAQAVITWGAAQNISGDTDVATNGTLVRAFNFGGTGVSPSTLNSVLFEAFEISSSTHSVQIGDFTLSESPDFITGTNFLTPDVGSGLYVDLSSSYKLLLSSAVTPIQNVQTITLSLGGLTTGHSYLFEWWSNNSSSTGSHTTSATGNNDDSVSLLRNSSGVYGELGQYVIGTFTATGTAEAIYFTGGDALPIINAFQLRDVTAVPEPATWALFAGIGALALAWRRCAKSATS